jgi:hypothetical protein
MEKNIRMFATDEQTAKRLHKIAKLFPNTDEFYTILREHVLKQQITVEETDWVVNNLVENHRGTLYVADVMELCKEAKEYRFLDEVLERKQRGESISSAEEIRAESLEFKRLWEKIS